MMPANLEAVQRQYLLLVMPPVPGLLRGFSSGLVSLANYVDQHVEHVSIQIANLSECNPSELADQLGKFLLRREGRILVGISTTTASYASALHVARVVRQLSPGAEIVFGGPHASADAETVLRSHHSTLDSVDYVIVGESEKGLAALVGGEPLETVPGLVYLDGEDLVRNAAPPLLTSKELDSIPPTFRGDGYFGSPGKFDHATYVSARGCPLRCAFCAVANREIRAKSVPAVVADIEGLIRQGYRRIAIEDNFFAHAPKRTRELCIALREIRGRSRSFGWDCQTRVESLASPELIAWMAEAGCEAVYIGVESVNEDQLNYLQKAANGKHYLDVLRQRVIPNLLASPLDCYLNLQFGLPGETETHADATLEFLAEAGAEAAAHGRYITIFPMLHVVYPGTTHFSAGVAQGRFRQNVFETFCRWEQEQQPILEWLGVHFAHGVGGLPEGILDSDLLRDSRYVVDPAAVCRVSTVLTQADALNGVRVFKYGEHLVGARSARSLERVKLETHGLEEAAHA